MSLSGWIVVVAIVALLLWLFRYRLLPAATEPTLSAHLTMEYVAKLMRIHKSAYSGMTVWKVYLELRKDGHNVSLDGVGHALVTLVNQGQLEMILSGRDKVQYRLARSDE